MFDKASKITADAWERANTFIKNLATSPPAGSANAQADFVNKLKGLSTGPGYVTALKDALSVAGYDGTDIAAVTWESLAQVYGTKGIPLEVWAGKLLYNPSGKKGTPAYTAASTRGKETRALADDLRAAVRDFKRAVAMLEDVQNVATAKDGNPGGIADATKDPKGT